MPTNYRRIELVRGTWGAVLLVAPGRVMHRMRDVRVDDRSVVVARILGARQLTQATLSGFRPSAEVLAMGVWVDAVHALTALGLVYLDRTRARLGFADAATAGIWAGLGYRDLTRAGPSPHVHQRTRDHLARCVLRLVPGGRRLMATVTADRRRPPTATADRRPTTDDRRPTRMSTDQQSAHWP